MGLRDRMSRASRRRRDGRRDHVADLAEIRELARAASGYEDVPVAPAGDRVRRSGFVDVEPSPPDERDADADGVAWPDPVEPADPENRERRWTHRWDPIEGGDLTPWMSPEERRAAAAEAEPDEGSLLPKPPRRPFPFTPTHEYVHEVYDPTAEAGPWRPERHEFMVVDRGAHSRESWEQGGGPEFRIGPTGQWWSDALDGGPAFESEDAPAALPWRYIPWRDEAGSWNTLAAQDEVEVIPRRDDRSTAELALDRFLAGWRQTEGAEERVASAFGRWPADQEPVDLEDAVHIARGDADRLPALDGLDAVEARREDEWAAPEPAAAALDLLAERNAPRDEGSETAGRWNPVEPGVTAWTSPEERAAAAAPVEDGAPTGTARPFTPTHTYDIPAGDQDGLGEPARAEFMVVGTSAYLADSWERDAPPDFRIAPDGSWWHPAAGCLFDPGDAPIPLPQIEPPVPDGVELTPTGEPILASHVDSRDEATAQEMDARAALHEALDRDGSDIVLTHEELDQEIGEAMVHGYELRHPAAVTDTDRKHPDFLAAQEEDRLDAVEARREDERAASERAAEALDRAADRNGMLFEGTARDADGTAAEPVPEEPRRMPAELADRTSSEAEAIRPEVEHDLELGLE